MIYNLCEEQLQRFKYFTAKGVRVQVFSLCCSKAGHKSPTGRGNPWATVKDLLVLTLGWRALGVMFYIQTGSLPPALTSPSHGTRACTHILTPVTACYSPINRMVKNEPMCH